jgi:hypothetical protein
VGARPLGLSLSITPLYLTKIPLFNTRAIVCRSVSISGEELSTGLHSKISPTKDRGKIIALRLSALSIDEERSVAHSVAT